MVERIFICSSSFLMGKCVVNWQGTLNHIANIFKRAASGNGSPVISSSYDFRPNPWENFYRSQSVNIVNLGKSCVVLSWLRKLVCFTLL